MPTAISQRRNIGFLWRDHSTQNVGANFAIVRVIPTSADLSGALNSRRVLLSTPEVCEVLDCSHLDQTPFAQILVHFVLKSGSRR